MERSTKGPLVEPSEDTLAGMLSNTIAGPYYLQLPRLQRRRRVRRGQCVRVRNARGGDSAEKLASSAADFVLAGGVDVSLDRFGTGGIRPFGCTDTRRA
ncbi:unnamed protein product, partial [Mesorhabditis spiculigera]